MVRYFNKYELKENKKEYCQELKRITGLYKDKEYIEEVVKLDHDLNILDIGTGSNGFPGWLVKNGYENVKSCDIDDYRSYSLDIPFEKIDVSFEKFPYDDGEFDVIFCLNVLEHVENPFNMFREVNRVLKSNGLFVIAIPNGWNIFSKFSYLLHGKIEGWAKNNNHICFLPENKFWQFLSNYKLEKAIYTKRCSHKHFPLRHFRNVCYPKTKFFSKKICYFLRRVG